jgi:leader peptidase (prepilin peptidase)/N-methyltransferase
MSPSIYLHLIFGFIGLLAGGVINVLADDLPRRIRPQLPHCPDCQHRHSFIGWLAVGRFLFQGRECPECGLPTRPRALIVEIGTMLWLGMMPAFVTELNLLIIYSFYSAVLILIMVIDLETKLILHLVTFPTTVIAIILSNFMGNENSLISSLTGAVTGFIFFYILYWIGQLALGPGALGFGDVTLSMTMGAMLGFHRIIFTLVLGILIGGGASLILIASGRRGMYLPYGQYLAVAGLIMLVWGQSIFEWYIN